MTNGRDDTGVDVIAVDLLPHRSLPKGSTIALIRSTAGSYKARNTEFDCSISSPRSTKAGSQDCVSWPAVFGQCAAPKFIHQGSKFSAAGSRILPLRLRSNPDFVWLG